MARIILTNLVFILYFCVQQVAYADSLNVDKDIMDRYIKNNPDIKTALMYAKNEENGFDFNFQIKALIYEYDAPYAGKKLSRKELQRVLAKHKEWLQSYVAGYLGNSPEPWLDERRADLRYAVLCGANLRGVNLDFADLSNANLQNADLSDAELQHIDLSHSNLRGAKLNRAELFHAILFRTKLNAADLTNASFKEAFLYGADFRDAKLQGAELRGADISNTTFEPKSLPDVANLYGVRGLSTIYFLNNSTSTVTLRDAFNKAGLKREAKILTSVLFKNQQFSMNYFELLFSKYVLGGYITDYGANPFGAFNALLIIIPIFSPIYLIVLIRLNKNTGIWRIRSVDRIIKEAGEIEQERLIYHGLKQLWRAIFMAIYFSFLSTFHFGWRDLNVASWIVRIQKREYVLRPTGWVRSISGIQSLISLYFVALWVITYFGTPFE